MKNFGILNRHWVWVFLTLFISGCGKGYDWGWYVVSPLHPQGQTNIQFLISGLGYTLQISLIAILLSILLGLLVALLTLTKHSYLKKVNRVYVEIFRSIPILVMLLWVYYGLPPALGIRLDVLWAGVLALALCDSAFEAEIFRAGIQSIERGQHDAANSLGLGFILKMRLIVLPQAIKRILPAIGNQFVYMLKMSSLVSVIGMTELTRRADELVVSQYRPLEIYTFLVFEYFLLIIVVSSFVRWLEKKLQTDA
ncbi:MAG: amino acid ABC transporter permease [SAR324 cluster bacterium]|jgi:polar amino acid transport system permease protein|uniref:ABC transmembrane type-1 domain-containing protein n=1 Tax=marine metagenome TaxID=408172 RepID=A0A382BDV0_9ZZZZ|nr:amino acid ABC transporter permease [Deltaproteobacteria bacterium]MAE00613.1 amino acid ABC transporter permease [Pseudomonadota bacterium]MDP6092409.1 amino acid ABC transporter permease [SAR324 cluster bacterium]MBP43417.1 amino acid ABC transporter permease [Deltaproteobacteria bacterium]MDP6247921.1 amino acid ABC transporter permease [SAR324 cluster bacterium]|tara:strand:+ start:4410 stop:5168 length:759 start_codon:yes stop_codon:yes gene_type:complete